MLAKVIPAGRSIVFLEGGYDLAALERSSQATVRGWLDAAYLAEPTTQGINPDAYLQRAAEVAARYWELV